MGLREGFLVMGLLANEYSDETERKAVLKLMKDYDKGINRHLNRLNIVEKELEEGSITSLRLKDLILATTGIRPLFLIVYLGA